MRRYGGLTANDSEVKNCEVIDDYKYEYMGEYKYLLETFFNEVWNRAEEYQKMFKETVQNNKKLVDKQQQQDREIALLKQKLTATQTALLMKDAQIHELKEEIEKHKSTSRVWEQQFELQDLKTERAHQRRIEEEEKVKNLERKCEKFRKELVTTSNRRKFFETRTRCLQSRIEDERIELEEKDMNLGEMKTKLGGLNELVRRANEKVRKDHETIVGLSENILRYRRKISEMQERDVDMERSLRQMESCIGKKPTGKWWKCMVSACDKDNTIQMFEILNGPHERGAGLENDPRLRGYSCCLKVSTKAKEK